tara:strand:- start:55 stop:276 length:222 start_codon:yes stop_codon:yes gene_type:complete
MSDTDIDKAVTLINGSGLTTLDIYRLKSDTETKNEIKKFISENNIPTNVIPDDEVQKSLIKILVNRGYAVKLG